MHKPLANQATSYQTRAAHYSAAVVLAALAQFSEANAQPPPRPIGNVLTQATAEYRKRQVADVSYELRFVLDATLKTYRGEVAIRFRRPGDAPREELTIDYHQGKVTSLVVNGHPVDGKHNGEFISIPGEAIREQNVISVGFEASYDAEGLGLMRFVDPVDNKVYIHSELEPYAAHHLFPCLDQPDIKARFRVEVTAPMDWTIISNSTQRAQRPQTTAQRQAVTQFVETPPISPYVVALIAGPFAKWQSHKGSLPLAIYARASLSNYMDPEEVFAITAHGLDYYTKYFNRAYPFDKYDLIFIPEMPWKGMENVAAVALKEAGIFRQRVTEAERLDRANTLLHELAHMWFGNLVTLRWWNDLWLNESFATFMTALAMEAETQRYPGAWLDFLGVKHRGYVADALRTTHAVASTATDTDVAETNFDGITYGKGAASLRQLESAIGSDKFREGVRRFIAKHAFATATLSDFIAALQAGTNENLGRWSADWLTAAGLNSVTPIWQCAGGRIKKLSLRQSVVSGSDLLRTHRTRLALLGGNGVDELRIGDRLVVTYAGQETTVVKAKGMLCPEAVFPNLDDLDYVKISLDDTSLKFLKEHLSQLPSPLLRQQTWDAMWEATRDGQMDVFAFLSSIRQHLGAETSHQVVETQLNRVLQLAGRYLPLEARPKEIARIEAFFESQLNTKPNADDRLPWLHALVDLPRVGCDASQLNKLLHDPALLGNNQELRWHAIISMAAAGRADIKELVASERERDPSDVGRNMAARAEAAMPDAASKRLWWNRFLDNDARSVDLLSAAMLGFRMPGQDLLLQPYVEEFYKVVVRVYEQRGANFAGRFVKHLYPMFADPSILTRNQAFLKQKGIPEPLRRLIDESNEELERVIKIHESGRAALKTR